MTRFKLEQRLKELNEIIRRGEANQVIIDEQFAVNFKPPCRCDETGRQREAPLGSLTEQCISRGPCGVRIPPSALTII